MHPNYLSKPISFIFSSPSLCHPLIPAIPRWKKPQREELATQQYFADYRKEQQQSADFVRVYRGVDEEGMPEMKISLRGSIMQKLSLGSQNRITTGTEQKSLLEDDGTVQQPESDHEDVEMV